MSGNSSPLIQTLTPERWAGWSMDFIGAGRTGLLVKNGRLVRTLIPGRHFSFALPFLEQCQLVLVDTKVRNLEIVSQGDFLSRDQYLVNVSLNVMYQVVDAKRVALELSDPIAALTSAVKDNLGVAIGQMRVEQLTTHGRVQVRQYLLDHSEVSYALGFALEDVRVSDISFPQTRGIIRQVEGLSARQEAEHEATLKMQIAQAGRPEIPPPPVQQVNIVSGRDPNANEPALGATLEATTFAIEGQPVQASLPVRDRPMLAPTVLETGGVTKARLVHRVSGAIAILSTNPFTIGREPNNTLVLDDVLCSRNHALISQFTDPQGNVRYQLTDLSSSNGTYVGGQRLAPNQQFWLTPGNVIKIGTQEWTFEA
ncbi:FHA domain-containing protein [Microcoleus sp. FACHB-SPT15]|uniref:FHA domain-containing protein n=1 Tax=Microcoleus sp. FACHB-SPT15 TaxID=2692830 RepID=UPI00177B7509|nr:SPFH domain-containing protein [Microcoleus sp. FACHB-SPT15]MBD1809677.1 FHA domain-containing protein [Microcoleus sp. FACHB-SPT15]